MPATFVPEAGMVGLSLRHEGEELLVHRASLPEYRAGFEIGVGVSAR
jgi:hypothetical protein